MDEHRHDCIFVDRSLGKKFKILKKMKATDFFFELDAYANCREGLLDVRRSLSAPRVTLAGTVARDTPIFSLLLGQRPGYFGATAFAPQHYLPSTSKKSWEAEHEVIQHCVGFHPDQLIIEAIRSGLQG